MADARPRPPEHVHLLKALASLALDYLRWTQLVPMLFGWTFLVLLVAALLLTNFQDRSFSLIERGLGVYEQLIGPIEAPADSDPGEETGPPPAERPNGESDESSDESSDVSSDVSFDESRDEARDGGTSSRFTDDDIMPVVLRGWALLALVGWLFGVLRSMLFGPREPARLGQKLRIAAYCAIGCSGLMWIAYLLGSGTFNGGPLGWALLFTGIPFGVWLVSLWSLGVGHVIGIVQRHLHT